MRIFQSKLSWLIPTLLVFATVSQSCSDDKCTLNCNGDMRFPLVIGYSWQYQGVDHLTNFRPDSDTITEIPRDTLVEYIVTVTVTGSDTLDDNTIVYFLHEVRSIGDSLIAEGYQCYGNKPDGLYHYVNLSSGNSLLLFKASAGVGEHEAQIDFARKSLEYPLREGLQWEYTNGFDYGPEGAIYKDILGIGEQDVPDGTYECYEIDWIWENLPGVTHSEYVADIGLVRSVTIARNIRYLSYNSMNGIGLIDQITDLRLANGPF
jgi:hypothetical protein